MRDSTCWCYRYVAIRVALALEPNPKNSDANREGTAARTSVWVQ